MLNRGRFKMAAVAVVLGALMAMTGGLVISQAAGGSSIQATVYDNAVRFAVQSEKVAVMRAEVFNLSGKRLYDSGPVMGKALDWNMATEAGERAAHGVYLYVITAWDSQGQLVKSQVGKLALVPGGVSLGQAPALVPGSEGSSTPEKGSGEVRALAGGTACGCNELSSGDVYIAGKVGIGTTIPGTELHIGGVNPTVRLDGSTSAGFQFYKSGTQKWNYTMLAGTSNFALWNNGGTNSYNLVVEHSSGNVGIGTTSPGTELHIGGVNPTVRLDGSTSAGFQFYKSGTQKWNYTMLASTSNFALWNNGGTNSYNLVVEHSSGKVGIGTTSPSATLEVHGSADNLFALYDPNDGDAGAYTAAEFRVTKSGDVYADGAYHGASFNTNGGADVAERINTSEWVEKGNVIEIDPEHPGFFRKTRSPYSTGVAGVISTSPGVVLGNSFDPKADKWEDNRPMLALTGRVPVKVTTENGPIAVGDLLVSSSTTGYAMRCSGRAACVGATIGKALESLEEGSGTIMVQVTLR